MAGSKSWKTACCRHTVWTRFQLLDKPNNPNNHNDSSNPNNPNNLNDPNDPNDSKHDSGAEKEESKLDKRNQP